MDATHHWPFTQVYSIWNATVAALQFLTADLMPHILNNVIEQSTQHFSAAIPYSNCKTCQRKYSSVAS